MSSEPHSIVGTLCAVYYSSSCGSKLLRSEAMVKTSKARGSSIRSGHLAFLLAPDLRASTMIRRFTVPSAFGFTMSPNFETMGSEK